MAVSMRCTSVCAIVLCYGWILFERRRGLQQKGLRLEKYLQAVVREKAVVDCGGKARRRL